MKELLALWEVGDVVSEAPIPSYQGGVVALTVASGTRYVLKRRDAPEDMDREVRLLVFLAEL
jgi:hypothetical protein